MTVDGSRIGAAIGSYDKNALRKRQEQLAQTARIKEEGQKQAMRVLTEAMEQETPMEEARAEANDLLSALSTKIIATCMSQAQEHLSDIMEKNQKRADELEKKKREKEERKQRKEEREAIRQRKLVLKRVLVPAVQAENSLEQEVPVEKTRTGAAIDSEEMPDDAYMVSVQKYVMVTETTAPIKIRSLLNVKA